MPHYQSVRPGRVFVLELAPGEDILLCVERLVAEQSLRHAVFQAGSGAVDHCRSHFAAKNEQGEYRDYPLAWDGEPRQLCAVGGFIEQGRVHLHGVLGNPDESWTVHLHEGCICCESFRMLVTELLDASEEAQ